MQHKPGFLLDNSFKTILAEKVFLAYILKYCVKEYEHEDISTIMKDYIEPHIRISTQSLHSRIIGSRNESNEDDQRITYDIAFEASLPSNKDRLGLRINVEVQSHEMEYSLLSRAHYYNARLLSSQKGRFFVHSDYDDLLKVYSIWIVICPQKKKQNSINRYHMEEEHLIGEYEEEEKRYNLQEIIMVYLTQEESAHQLITLLSLLADEDMDAEKKIERLKNEFKIEISDKLEKEVRKMCNYSQWVKEEGLKEGRLQGITEGRKRMFDSICALMKNMSINMDEAMRLLNIPESEVSIFKNMKEVSI